jgi:hypothetical protein
VKETFFSESTEKDASTSAKVLLRGTVGPFTGATPLVTGVVGAAAVAAGCAATGAFLALNSSAHDFGATGFGGDAALVVSSTSSPAGSEPSAGFPGVCWFAMGDLTDFCVVEAVLGAFADLIGMRGIAGIVAVRACFVAVADDCADGVTADGVVTCARSTSEGGCEVEGVSTSASEGTAAVEASDSAGSSVGV